MLSSLKGKTFLLGVGAMKSGTTWVFDYLSNYQCVSCSPLKEVHYFDALCRPDLFGKRDDIILREVAGRLKGYNKCEQLKKDEKLLSYLDRLKMCWSKEAYFEHFKRISNGANFFCEVTPAYSLIKKDGFRLVKEMAEREGVSLKVFLLLRDPVERHWSHLRFSERKGKFDAKEYFFESLNDASYVERGRYENIVPDLLEVFGSNNVYIDFYEEFFREKNIKEMIDFFGIKEEFVAPEVSNKVGKTHSEKGLEEKARVAARDAYIETYNFCENYFGRLPHKWIVNSSL